VKAEIGSGADPDGIKRNVEKIKEAGGREVVFLCPTCLRTFMEYDEKHRTGLVFETLLSYLGKHFSFTSLTTDPEIVTYHDPCHLGRGLESYDGARALLKGLGSKFLEMEHHHQKSLCCGAGGGVRAFYPKFSRDIARRRVKEAEEVKADILLTDCVSCKHNLKQGVPFEGKLTVMTTPEYLLKMIEEGKIHFTQKAG
jgi:Fe-S oxidoreductase